MEKILNKELTGKLPGERQLSKKFGFSYMTIRHAINELTEEGYLYKEQGRGTFVNEIRRKRTFNIGFYLAERIIGGISCPYYSLLFKTIEREIQKESYNLIYFSNINDVLSIKATKKVDGIIATSFPEIEKEIMDVSKFLPTVIIDNDIKNSTIPSILIDNLVSSYHAVSFLIKAGHRRIGYVTGLLDSSIGINRLDGYKKALMDHGIEIDPGLIFEGQYNFASGYKSADFFINMKERPTGIVCANDEMAIGLIKGIKQRDLDVPEDISVMGFDDIEDATQIHPSLTTMRVPVEQLTVTAKELLLKIINNETIKERNVILNTELVSRESVKVKN